MFFVRHTFNVSLCLFLVSSCKSKEGSQVSSEQKGWFQFDEFLNCNNEYIGSTSNHWIIFESFPDGDGPSEPATFR